MLLRLLSELFSRKRTVRETFTRIYKRNLWEGGESRSGTGSGITETGALREELSALIARLRVTSVLDAPCGDFFWMKDIVLDRVNYVGADIVRDIIRDNQERHGTPSRRFTCLDITRDALPHAELILCRDCLVHMTFAHAHAALANFKRTGATYLLTTTFNGADENRELIGDLDWRPLNLELDPFNFHPPVGQIDEGRLKWGTQTRTKSLGLWRLADVP